MKNYVQILYTKPDSNARDGRALAQLALATCHTHFDSNAWSSCKPLREGTVGPCPLARIIDFIGYDQEVSKPGASARVEQFLGGSLFFVLEPPPVLIIDMKKI